MDTFPISPKLIPEILLLLTVFLAPPGDSLRHELGGEGPIPTIGTRASPTAAPSRSPESPPALHPWVLWWERGRDGPVVWECFPVYRGPVDPNLDPPGSLALLPGIGPALAERLVRSREEEGPFRELEDLRRVRGIGPVKLEGLRDNVALP